MSIRDRCVCVCVCVCARARTRAHLYVCVHVCVCAVRLCLCAHGYVRACMCVHKCQVLCSACSKEIYIFSSKVLQSYTFGVLLSMALFVCLFVYWLTIFEHEKQNLLKMDQIPSFLIWL